MEHEVVEPQVEVRLQLLDVLIRVVRHQPAPVRDLLDAARKTFHLARIVHTGLCFRRQGKRRPDFGVFHRARTIRVV